MAKITIDEVKRLAKLAKLRFTESEAEDMAVKLASIFEMLDEINNYDTAGTQQTAQVTGLNHVVREDKEIDYQVTADELLKAVPKTRNHSIEVPSVQ